MPNYNSIYKKSIDNKKFIAAGSMVRGKFYLLKSYDYVDGESESYSDSTAPILFTLFVSKSKDIVHAVKVTGVNPKVIKKFFSNFINEETDELEMRGGAKAIYSNITKKVPAIRNDNYRTYKLSGIKKVLELDLDINTIGILNKKDK